MVVLDTSTLILIAKSDLLILFADAYPIKIPAEVEREALARQDTYDAKMIRELLKSGKIGVSRSHRSVRRRQLQLDFRLEAGEAAALLMAKDQELPLGTDDGPAIKAAKILGVPFFTAIHVLLDIHEKKQMSTDVALAKLDVLQYVGRYSVRILEDARTRIQGAR